MRRPSQAAQIRLLVAKDLRVEFRSRQALLTTAFFAVVVLVIFKFSFDPGDPRVDAAIPGILWVSLLFPGVIQLNHSFQQEEEQQTITALLLAPLDAGSLYLAKVTANWLFLLLVDAVILAAFIVLFNPVIGWPFLWIVLLLVSVGLAFSAVGTLFAAMLSRLRTRDVLLPVLLFPILVPILLAAVNGTRDVLAGGGGSELMLWLRLLAACDVIFTAAGWVVFEYVIRD